MGQEGRESLSMETTENQQISFKQEKGCFLKYCTIFLLVIVYLSSILATGIIVYYVWSKPGCTEQLEIIQHEAEVTTRYDDLRQKEEIKKAGVKEKPISSEMPQEAMKKSASINMRLPRNVNPLHYYVRLIPYINGNFSINGYVELTFEVLEPTMNVTLHINDIITKNETIRVVPESDPDGIGLPIKSHTFDKERQFYIAKFNQELKKGKKYIIKIGYEAYLNDNNAGFYRSSYKDEMGKTRWLAITQFQPTDARRAFPCMDEPEFRTSYTIQLGRETKMSTLSNMPINETFQMEGRSGWSWDKFEKSVEMSTYLVAFAVCDFKYLRSSDKNLKYDFRVWTRESGIALANYSIEIGPKISRFFEDFFNVPYPLPKQDMIAIPDMGGAMENWGLITYEESRLLYDPKSSSARDKFATADIIAHELAHQWFGNLVTPTWWTDLWLNEGFASYMESVSIKAVEPSFKAEEMVLVKDLYSVFSLDCLETSHPISVKVGNPDEIASIFDKISYQKGSSIIRMMSHFLTEETFRRALSKYLTGLAFKTAEQDDLWQYLTKQAHEDATLSKELTVKKVMDTWTLQMGYPVISVKKNMHGTATIQQERFLLEKSKPSTHDYKWWIPINYATQENPDFDMTRPKEWMSPSESTKVIENIPYEQWVIFNTQQTGYYRVNYEEENWRKIVRQLMMDHTVIATANRAQLIDDSMALARAGLLPYETAFKLLSYLKNEMEYVPWKAALDSLEYIKEMFSQKGGYGALKEFILSLVKPVYAKITFADSLTDPLPKQFLRAIILHNACSLGYQQCIAEANKLFKQLMKNPNNESIISPNLKRVVYNTAIAQGGYEEWNFTWKKFESSSVQSEKRTLISALGFAKENWILKGYLESAFTEGSPIRKHEALSVAIAVAKNDAGRLLAWEYLKDKWIHIKEYFGSGAFSLRNIVKYFTQSLNTENEINELKEFVSKWKGNFGSGKRSTEQAIENAENNLRWMRKNYQSILNWLTENGFTNTI